MADAPTTPAPTTLVPTTPVPTTPAAEDRKSPEPDGGAEVTSDPKRTHTAPVPPAVKDAKIEAYYEVSPAEHARRVKTLTAKGFRPISLSITDQGYTALWHKTAGPAFVTAHELTAEQYRRFFRIWAAKGYNETVAAAHGAGPTFASVMEKRATRAMSYFGLTAKTLRSRNTQALDNGLMPVWVSAYGSRFNVAWTENTDAVDWSVTVNQTRSEYNKEFDRRWDQGYVPMTSTVGTNGLFTAVWRSWRGPVYSYTGLSAARHTAKVKELRSRGYRLLRLTSTQVGDQVQYSLFAVKD